MLTKSERKIMEMFWNTNEAISCVNIMSELKPRNEHRGYTYALLRSLLKKGYITMDDSRPDRLYPKTYRPSISKSEYVINEYFGNNPNRKDIKQIIQCAVDTIDNLEDLKAIELYVTSHRIKNGH